MNDIELFWRVYKGKPVKDQRSNAYEIYARHVAQANHDWGGTAEFSVFNCHCSNEFLVQDLYSLKLCLNCSELYGQVKLKTNELVMQECLCTKRTEAKWYGYDFNIKYEICNCCGLEVIPSGSRWSPLHCKDCQDRIVELNDKVGQCVIPIGRHSIMNGIALNGQMPISAIGQFVNSVNGMNNRLELMTQHRKRILVKHAKILNFSKDTLAIDLILKTNDMELRQMKTEAFFELLASCTNMSVDKVKSSYEEIMK